MHISALIGALIGALCQAVIAVFRFASVTRTTPSCSSSCLPFLAPGTGCPCLLADWSCLFERPRSSIRFLLCFVLSSEMSDVATLIPPSTTLLISSSRSPAVGTVPIISRRLSRVKLALKLALKLATPSQACCFSRCLFPSMWPRMPCALLICRLQQTHFHPWPTRTTVGPKSMSRSSTRSRFRFARGFSSVATQPQGQRSRSTGVGHLRSCADGGMLAQAEKTESWCWENGSTPADAHGSSACAAARTRSSVWRQSSTSWLMRCEIAARMLDGSC